MRDRHLRVSDELVNGVRREIRRIVHHEMEILAEFLLKSAKVRDRYVAVERVLDGGKERLTVRRHCTEQLHSFKGLPIRQADALSFRKPGVRQITPDRLPGLIEHNGPKRIRKTAIEFF